MNYGVKDQNVFKNAISVDPISAFSLLLDVVLLETDINLSKPHATYTILFPLREQELAPPCSSHLQDKPLQHQVEL